MADTPERMLRGSNMTKCLPDGPVINEDGKIVKGPGYEPPDIAGVLGLACEVRGD